MGLGRKRYGVLASARARGEVQEARGLTLEACEAVAKQEGDGGGRNRAQNLAGAAEGTGRRRRLRPSWFDSLHGDAAQSEAEAMVCSAGLGAALIDGDTLGGHGCFRVS